VGQDEIHWHVDLEVESCSLSLSPSPWYMRSVYWCGGCIIWEATVIFMPAVNTSLANPGELHWALLRLRGRSREK